MRAYLKGAKVLALVGLGAGLLTGCGDDEEKEAFLAKLAGTWNVGGTNGCIVKGENSIKTQYTVAIESEDDEIYTYTLSETYYIGNTECTTAAAEAMTVSGSGKFDLGEAVEGLEDTFNVTETPTKIELTVTKADWVDKANGTEWQDTGFCGMQTWATNTPVDVTGKTCKIGTSFTKTYLLAQAAYDIMQIKDSELTRGKTIGTTEETRPTELAEATADYADKKYYKSE